MNKLIIALMMLLLVSTTVGAQEFQGKAEYFSKFIFKSKKKLTDEIEKVNESLQEEIFKIVEEKISLLEFRALEKSSLNLTTAVLSFTSL